MAYSRGDIDRVKDATDLVELAEEVTKVKRSGRSRMAVCPFHQEKTPSLSLDAARGLYHCFGCGKSGDVFTWVQEVQGVDFTGAVELLARRAGITLTRDPAAAKRHSRRERLIEATEAAVSFYHDILKSHADAAGARSYLRGRGYDGAVVEEYRLGYAPDSWDALTGHLRRAGFRAEVMVGAGLVGRSRTGRLIDRFRGRLMFPIFDVRGDAVGFGARILEGDGPKYLNSPETEIYHKSRLLYGLNWAKGDIVREGTAVVVEGYTDVIAFRQAGHAVAVATCGTALGPDHLDLLRRFAERVVLAFDADAAGAGAALRGFEHSVPGDLDLRVAALPAGRDPADLVSGGDTAALLKAIDESEPLMQFRIDRELGRFDLSEAEARGRAVTAAGALVALHPDPVVRHEYAVLIGRRTGVDLEVVEEAVARATRRQGRPAPEQERPRRKLSGTEKAERELLRLLLANDPGLRAHELDPALFTDPDHRAAFERLLPAILGLPPGEPPDLGSLLGGQSEMLAALALDETPLGDAGELVARLEADGLERQIEATRRELESLDADADEELYSSRLAALIAFEKQRRERRSNR